MMNLSRISTRSMRFFVMLFLLAAVLPRSAEAVNQQILAVFKPNPANPQFNEFQNRTLTSGFCLDNPPQCRAENLFSLRLPIQSFSNATIQGGHNNQRMGAMFNIPSQWQSITVTHPTAPPQEVMFRIAGMGVAYKLPKLASELTNGVGHNFLWEGGSWSYPGPPCAGLGGAGNDIGFNSFWRHPIGTGSCAKRAMFDIPQPFKYETFDITYELRTPNPLQMVTGQYTGQHVFRVGPGQDFDLGDVMVANDDVIVLDFLLDVEHELKVEIPPGGNKVQLIPPGGWQSWLHTGRKPTRLFRDQTFNISASSRFKMSLECEILELFNCAIRDPRSQKVAVVQVSVSLPNGLTDLTGQPVNRRPLRIGLSPDRQVFQPGFYVDRAPAILHFEMSPYYVSEIVQAGVAANYRGNITVIWDSEV